MRRMKANLVRVIEDRADIQVVLQFGATTHLSSTAATNSGSVARPRKFLKGMQIERPIPK